MAESVYKVIELVGTSPTSWERAAAAAVKIASRSLRDLRIAEVTQLDMHLEDGKVVVYRAKLKVSFKYATGESGAEPVEKAPAPKPAAPKPAAPKPAARKAAPAPEPAAAPPARRGKKKGRRKKA